VLIKEENRGGNARLVHIRHHTSRFAKKGSELEKEGIQIKHSALEAIQQYSGLIAHQVAA
jgi:chaperonin GroEL (HSP60 family)